MTLEPVALEHLELATAEWLQWWNNHRLQSVLGL